MLLGQKDSGEKGRPAVALIEWDGTIEDSQGNEREGSVEIEAEVKPLKGFCLKAMEKDQMKMAMGQALWDLNFRKISVVTEGGLGN